MTGIQTNRNAENILLPKEISSQIWQDAQAESVVMSVANSIALPGAGIQIPMITGDPTAAWVGETDEIVVGDSTFSNKSIAGYKIGIIELFSNEFARDLPALYGELAKRLPKTIAKAFDSTVLHAKTGPGADFDTLGSGVESLTLDTTDAYGDLVAIDTAVTEAGGENTGWVLAPKARSILLNARDADDRPLLINDIQRQGGVSALLGTSVRTAPQVYKAKTASEAETLGFAGDWSQTMYGVVEGIEIAKSTEASVTKGDTVVNLFQRDMFALRVTAHLGFGVRDKAKIVRVVGAPAGA